jgi:transposase
MKAKQKKYKNSGQFSIFSYDDTTQMLSRLGNILEKLLKAVDFEAFKPTIELEFSKNPKKNAAGAKPYDYILMFKILILQFCYGLSDEQAEYQIYDRHSFKRFLNLADGDKVPDAKTIWLFREKLSIHGLEKKIFEQFTEIMKSRGLIVNEGKMVDASFTTVPIQRNTKDENALIKGL